MYIRRLAYWLRLMRVVRGVSAQDNVVVAGVRRIATHRGPLTARMAGSVLLRDIVADVSGIGRFALRARTDDLLHVLPFREPAVLECIEARLGPGDCFVHAGANIGVYSILAANKVGARALFWPSR